VLGFIAWARATEGDERTISQSNESTTFSITLSQTNRSDVRFAPASRRSRDAADLAAVASEPRMESKHEVRIVELLAQCQFGGRHLGFGMALLIIQRA